ncbi:hypothetical protein SSX86_011021 [Deinandra increscens subsp. villosa]|uniref:RING-type domain-containing protein n=1 Tax=Deinandra increscens subsp. villosa TaxID=3103831 RepID=A0AAP0H2V1_9ASTR
MADFQIKAVWNVIFRIFTALITCTGGAVIGLVSGAIKGQTTETGLVRGAGVGAVSGAIIALQAVDMIANGEPFSKVVFVSASCILYVYICSSLVSYISFRYRSINIMLTSAMETSFTDIFNVENNVAKGLSEEVINDLPKCVFDDDKTCQSDDDKCHERNCVICLQDFENKEEGRELPGCKHVFHMKCIDEWLMRQGSCPICRRDVIV